MIVKCRFGRYALASKVLYILRVWRSVTLLKLEPSLEFASLDSEDSSSPFPVWSPEVTDGGGCDMTGGGDMDVGCYLCLYVYICMYAVSWDDVRCTKLVWKCFKRLSRLDY